MGKSLGSLVLVQVNLGKLIIERPGRSTLVIERANLIGVASATRNPETMPKGIYDQWRLAVLIDLTEDEFRQIVPKGTEHL